MLQSDFLRSIEIVKLASSTLRQTVGNEMNKFVSGLSHAATNEKETAEKVATPLHVHFCVYMQTSALLNMGGGNLTISAKSVF